MFGRFFERGGRGAKRALFSLRLGHICIPLQFSYGDHQSSYLFVAKWASLI